MSFFLFHFHFHFHFLFFFFLFTQRNKQTKKIKPFPIHLISYRQDHRFQEQRTTTKRNGAILHVTCDFTRQKKIQKMSRIACLRNHEKKKKPTDKTHRLSAFFRPSLNQLNNHLNHKQILFFFTLLHSCPL